MQIAKAEDSLYIAPWSGKETLCSLSRVFTVSDTLNKGPVQTDIDARS